MGLTAQSTGSNTFGKKTRKGTTTHALQIALAGNPNVGKSTVFNALTGLKQHTGNWSGKTVSNAKGYLKYGGKDIVLADIPGCYSLLSQSFEEEVARDFICFNSNDTVIVVCDAGCLQRNMNLVLQTLETAQNTVVCVNLIDEAKRKGITVDTKELEKILGVPVVATNARRGEGLKELLQAAVLRKSTNMHKPVYNSTVEQAIKILLPTVRPICENTNINARWLSVRLLENDKSFIKAINTHFLKDICENEQIKQSLNDALEYLEVNGYDSRRLKDSIITSIIETAHKICSECVSFTKTPAAKRDTKIDRIITSKYFGFPLMFLLLMVIFWLTISGANYPSLLIGNALFFVEDKLALLFCTLKVPTIITDMLIHGVYRVLAWIVSVMLPPMAIFFPLFTLLEDLGYLPRVAFNLDYCFKKCNACGKQSLTTCMGFGCNAAGVVGCRIIDSKRERLIAMLTNSFVPCNGRFPTLIAVITMFFAGVNSLYSSALSAIILAALIIAAILMTFLVSYILSKTVLKGVPSSFTLELPPYRKPQIGKIIVRSIFDRTIFVLGRAICVAAPAGLVIWLLANIYVGDTSLLLHCANFLDPFAALLGLDGVILIAFILGAPANEIVIPIIIMAYLSCGTLTDYESLSELKTLLVDNGWTLLTALNVMIFCLFHWPCTTTLLSIKKESGKWRYAALGFALPTVCGILLCLLTTAVYNLFH